MSEPIFRERAIKAYVDPDTRTPLLPLARPRASRFLLAVAAVTLAALVASAFLRVHVVATGRGVVRPRAGVVTVRASTAGTVRGVIAAPGTRVGAGEVLMSVGGPVTAPHAGILDVIAVHDGDEVLRGAVLARVVPEGDEVGYLAIPVRFRASLAVDQPVRLSIDEYPSDEMGFAHGHVSRIGADLLTEDLGVSPGPADEGPWVLVEVALDHPPRRAEDARFRNGMTFDGVIPLRTRPVLGILLPPLAGWLD